MYKYESVLENETDKNFWKFDIKTDHQILARMPDPVSIDKKKRTCLLEDFAFKVDHRVKNSGT